MESARVLLIDADPDSRTVYRLLLEYRGWEVVEASDGVEGLRSARDTAPAVVVMELSLTGMDGTALLAELRADARTRDIPVVVLTTRMRQPGTAEPACARYLVKPVAPSALVDLVGQLTGRKGSR